MEVCPPPRRRLVRGAGAQPRGLDRALRTGVNEVNAVVAVTDTFSRKNQNMSTEEAMRDALSVIADARSAGLFTTLTLSAGFGCPFEGEVPVERVVGLAAEAAGAGVQELALCETTRGRRPE